MILIDNTVLSIFALVHHPEFIRRAFLEDIGTTEEVFGELTAGVKLGRLPECEWDWLKSIPMKPSEQSQFHQLREHLGDGEASCLAIAAQWSWKVATDDKDARQWALRLQIPHTGTLGILSILIKHGHMELSEGNEWLRHMITAGYHSPMTTLDTLVRL